MQWLLAVREVASLLRDDVTLPLKPGSCTEVFTDVASATLLPTWHCAFRGCSTSSAKSPDQENHERGVWRHIWDTREHQRHLTRIARRCSSVEPHLKEEMICFTLYAGALAEKEREFGDEHGQEGTDAGWRSL